MTDRPMDDSLEAIRTVAEGLGDVLPEVAFVGGAVAPLLISDVGAEGVRPTEDVDVIVDLEGYAAYSRLTERLCARGFAPDRSEGAPLCRFRYRGVAIDLMPVTDAPLGFTNRWYRYAIDSAEWMDVGSARIRVVTAVAFVATKLEAFRSPTRRHGGDVLASHDLEDVLIVLDGHPEFEAAAAAAPDDVRAYISTVFGDLLRDPDFIGAVEGHLPPGPTQTERARRLLDMMRRLSGPV